MSRVGTALTTLKGIVACAIESPKCTIDALKLMPSVARGLMYGRAASFPSPPEPAESAREDNPLLNYFNAHTEGPGLWKWLHYFDIYHRHFSKFRGREVHVLEIGIYSGGSLGMWRNYFGSGCHIYGVDIEPACKVYQTAGVEVFIGDQSDRNFWREFRKLVPKVDILIDDGGHAPEQQRITLEEMLPHISPGGVYLCEDIGSMSNSFGGYVYGLSCHMNDAKRAEEVFDAPVCRSGFQSSVRSIIQYPYVTVIEKHDANPGELVSKKRGSEWQPY